MLPEEDATCLHRRSDMHRLQRLALLVEITRTNNKTMSQDTKYNGAGGCQGPVKIDLRKSQQAYYTGHTYSQEGTWPEKRLERSNVLTLFMAAG